MKVGDKVFWKGGEVRIMAIAEGYVMARRKGCYPFLEPVSEIEAAQQSVQSDGAEGCWLCGKPESDHPSAECMSFIRPAANANR